MKKFRDFHETKRNARLEFEDDEDDEREKILRAQNRSLMSIMGESGAFLKPLIRKRKDRAFQEEMEIRLEIMTTEAKLRRKMYEAFFDEEPDDDVPVPKEALEKVRRRYEFVKPTLDEEEEARKVILGEAREEVVKLFAVFELKRDKIKATSTWVPKKAPTVPWEEVERAANRRRLDEERAFSFLYGEQKQYQSNEVSEIRSPSNYYWHKKQEEEKMRMQQQQEMLLKKQREAQQALSFSSSSSSNRTPYQDPYNFNRNLHHQQQQQQNNTTNNISASSSNEKNQQKPGPVPLRVSFAAYWANQYKK